MDKFQLLTTDRLKTMSLLLLTFQSTALILVMRYIRTRAGDMFYSTTAVVVAEALKCLTCILKILSEEKSITGLMKQLKTQILDQPRDCLLISVPSFVYVIQNNLLFFALSNLEASTYQVTYQLKLLTTAVLSVIILKKSFSKQQWISLLVLFVGVSLIGIQLDSSSSSAEQQQQKQRPLLGLLAVFIACCLSGFAGVWLEKMLKHTAPSLWLRNIELGALGVLFGLATMLYNDGTKIWENGLFYGYDTLVWLAVFLQSVGGLIIAVVVKYCDNIIKGFCNSIAIVLSFACSVWFFGFRPTGLFVVGATLVVVSTQIYIRYPPSPKVPSLPFRG